MKKNYLFYLLLIFQSLIAQTGNYGKLTYSISNSMKMEDYDGMRKIVFDDKGENMVVINKIPNQSLPDLSNYEYSSMSNRESFLNIIKQMAYKMLEAKNSIEWSAKITSEPNFIYTGKIYLTAYSIFNNPKGSNQEIREIFLTIPDKNESYLIISTSFKYDLNFAQKFQTFLDSLDIK